MFIIVIKVSTLKEATKNSAVTITALDKSLFWKSKFIISM